MNMSKTSVRLAILSFAGALVGTAGAFAAISLGGETAHSITVRDGDVVVQRTSLDDALQEATERAGFLVVAPRNAPQGIRVRDILVHPELPALPGGAKPDFRLVSVQLEKNGKTFLLDELRGGFNPMLSGKDLGDVVAGADVYHDETDTAVIYSMLVKGRGFIMSFPKDQALDPVAAVSLLSAFAAELP